MKPYTILFLLFIIGGCSRTPDRSVMEILDDRELRNEIMAAIGDDQDMVIEMSKLISRNKHVTHLPESDYKIIQNMLESDREVAKSTMRRLITMMDRDSVLCENLSYMMMNDTHIRAVICNMCHCTSPDKSEDHGKMHEPAHRPDISKDQGP